MQSIADYGTMFRSKEEKTIDVQFSNLFTAEEGETYIIKEIRTNDDEMDSFLFRLGCYSGEPITIISKKKRSCTVAIKDSRYTLDRELCEAIII